MREVLEEFGRQKRRRAYTSVMSLMNVMAEKGLLSRRRKGRAFVYSARSGREKTLKGLVDDLWRRAFEGSASALVVHLLEQADPTEEELDLIRRAIDEYRRERGDG